MLCCAVLCCAVGLQLLQQEIIDETDQYVDNLQVHAAEQQQQRCGSIWCCNYCSLILVSCPPAIAPLHAWDPLSV
jgi:hypothetical protein